MDTDRPALIGAEDGEVVTSGDLAELANQFAAAVGGRRLVFLFGEQTLRSISLYRAAYTSGNAVALLDANVNEEFAAALIERYRPDVIVATSQRELPDDYAEVMPDVYSRSGEPTELHPDLSILLSTSGSTGSPKFVRLSTDNMRANTESIIDSLSLTDRDRAITSLPLYYSYGMSVINTHLEAGGAVVVSTASVFDRAFWDAVREHEVTILNGVPSTFAMLRRVGVDKMELPALRAMTQAGGKLSVDLIAKFADIMSARGGEFFVMYGQTEAAPRIACRSVTRSLEREGSAGVVLKHGTLSIQDDDGTELPVGETGEVTYRGPNVMMGYAEDVADLALGDVHGDVLHTGDLGRLDDDGFLYITGRSKRIAKVSGLRISLDDVEQLIVKNGPVAAVPAGDDGVVVYCEWGDESVYKPLQRQLCEDLKLPPKSIVLRHIDALPMLGSGKIDYQALQSRG